MPFRRESPQTGHKEARVRRALDSLVSDTRESAIDLSELTDGERAEVAALTRTAHLTRLVLHGDQADQTAEAAALGRAQTALRSRHPSPPAGRLSQQETSGGRATSWLGHLLGRMRDHDGDHK